MQEIDSTLCAPETLNDSGKIQALMIERDGIDKNLKEFYSKWEELNIKLENL